MAVPASRCSSALSLEYAVSSARAFYFFSIIHVDPEVPAMQRARRAFTLVELLVVIGIIGVL
ncbi:MAG TPA: type II secretion system protein, partial [Gemmataceae bacterium]|nr:type II secretion system protein [Gemmataceae bacterium]